jgi:hypothetical protein
VADFLHSIVTREKPVFGESSEKPFQPLCLLATFSSFFSRIAKCSIHFINCTEYIVGVAMD